MNLRLVPGVLAATALTGVVLAAFGALLYTAGVPDAGIFADAYLHRVVGFSFWQAGLSTFFSVALALPAARAFVRQQHFPGRAWLFKLLGLPLVVPVIVAVFGLVAIYGQNGLLNRMTVALGLGPQQYLYGLSGILIAHVFFNLPLAVRLLVPPWQAIPGESWRLAAQLGMSSWHILRHLEWPLLRRVIPRVAGLVFMLCFTSFAVVLTLGGGPAATTLEVAVYQALRFDFDLSRAAALALAQVGFCTAMVGLLQSLGGAPKTTGGGTAAVLRPDAGHPLAKWADYGWLVLMALGILTPLAAVVVAGASGPVAAVLADPKLWRSAALSVSIGLCAAVLAVAASVAIVLACRELRLHHRRNGLAGTLAGALEISGHWVLAVPPLVLGTGAFILLQAHADVFAWAPVLVIGVNAMMGIPYGLRLLGPPLTRIAQRHDRLCASLGLQGLTRLRLVEWPLARYPLGLALALCAALSTGDLGVIALFGSQDFTTLPLLIHQRLSAYRMGEAAVTALLLLGLCLVLFIGLERLVGGKHRA